MYKLISYFLAEFAEFTCKGIRKNLINKAVSIIFDELEPLIAAECDRNWTVGSFESTKRMLEIESKRLTCTPSTLDT